MLPSFVPVVLFGRHQPDYLTQNNVLKKRDSRWREIYEVLAARMRKLITARMLAKTIQYPYICNLVFSWD